MAGLTPPPPGGVAAGAYLELLGVAKHFGALAAAEARPGARPAAARAAKAVRRVSRASVMTPAYRWSKAWARGRERAGRDHDFPAGEESCVWDSRETSHNKDAAEGRDPP